MTLEQAGALLIIAAFAAFILWGRSPSGRAALGRVYGASPPRSRGRQGGGSSARPRRPSRRRARR